MEDAMQGVYSRIPAAALKAVEEPNSAGLMTAADFAEAAGCSLRAAQTQKYKGSQETIISNYMPIKWTMWKK